MFNINIKIGIIVLVNLVISFHYFIIIIVITINNLGLVQADSNSNGVKWNALRSQEIFYKTHNNTDLEYFREHLNLLNSTWCGAVSGFLF